jgi:hypothetical protein
MSVMPKSARHPHLREVISHLFHPRRSNNHRPKVLHHTAYIYFSAIVVVFVAALQALHFGPDQLSHILGFASSITPSEVIRQTNEERQKAGLPTLTLNMELTQAALAKGQDMMSDQYWAHIAPDGTTPWYFMQQAGYKYTVAGENLARDFGDTPTMVAAWMNSPTHRANILNPKYQEIGIAVIDGNLEGYDTTLVVQMFGKPTEAVANATVTDEAAISFFADSGQPIEEGQAVALAADEQANGVTPDLAQTQPSRSVLAAALVGSGELRMPPLFTPLQLSKAFFLALIMLIIGTLLYDAFVMGHLRTARMVGKNLAHLIFFSAIAFLVVFFKAGLVG